MRRDGLLPLVPAAQCGARPPRRNAAPSEIAESHPEFGAGRGGDAPARTHAAARSMLATRTQDRRTGSPAGCPGRSAGTTTPSSLRPATCRRAARAEQPIRPAISAIERGSARQVRIASRTAWTRTGRIDTDMPVTPRRRADHRSRPRHRSEERGRGRAPRSAHAPARPPRRPRRARRRRPCLIRALVRRSISSIAEPFGNTRESRRSPSEKPTRS